RSTTASKSASVSGMTAVWPQYGHLSARVRGSNSTFAPHPGQGKSLPGGGDLGCGGSLSIGDCDMASVGGSPSSAGLGLHKSLFAPTPRTNTRQPLTKRTGPRCRGSGIAGRSGLCAAVSVAATDVVLGVAVGHGHALARQAAGRGRRIVVRVGRK